MIAWMLYSVVVGAIVAAGAHAAERVARVIRIPTRWAWIAALLVTFTLSALAPYRRSSEPAEAIGAGNVAASTSDARRLVASLDEVTQFVPTSLNPIAITGWIVASGILGALIVVVYGRIRRMRRAWPVTEMHGARVRVSPSAGPVVLGLARPEIVVPRWLLTRSSEEQRLVIAHESEHLATHDALVLAAGTAACALMPWNPAVWFMFSRLRLSVEVDCDARVLRRGVEVQSYGTLLIEVAANAPRLRFGVAALANSPSHLHQRIVAMQHRIPKFARVRAGVATLFAAGALLVACQAEVPTAAEIDRMDVASAEMSARAMGSIAQGDSVTYIVEGNRVSKEDAYKLRAGDIASINVRGAKEAGQNIIFIRKIDGARRTPAPGGEEPIKLVAGKLAAANAPIFLIDGKRSTESDLKAIKRENIETVEVIKGAAAAAQYGAEAANGVIVVRTKSGK